MTRPDLFPAPTAETVVALDEDGALVVVTDEDVLAAALRRRFARKTNLSREHRADLDPNRPAVLFEMGTDSR